MRSGKYKHINDNLVKLFHSLLQIIKRNVDNVMVTFLMMFKC